MSLIRLFLLLILVNLLGMVSAHADAFVVSEIKIEGLKRLPDGTLLNYMPIVVGDPIDDTQVTYAISELYKTGFFADVQFFRDGDVLVVRVKERPSIADVEFSGNSDIEAHPVGGKDPNPLGLHDMHGNLWEWVGDWYGRYGEGLAVDPGGANMGGSRVLRGGSFDFSPGLLRSADRGVGRPEDGNRYRGFRCARVSPPSIDPLDH